MTDDFDDLDAMLAPSAVALAPAVELVTAEAFIADLERLLPLVRTLVAGFSGNRIRMDSPAERERLFRLRSLATDVLSSLSLVPATIERVFLTAAISVGAEVVPVPGTSGVRYEKPKGEYVIQSRPLRVELLRISALDGSPTLEEIDAAIREVTTLKPNHTHINKLAKTYGGEVKAAIDKHRQWVAPEPERGRVRFPEPEGGTR